MAIYVKMRLQRSDKKKEKIQESILTMLATNKINTLSEESIKRISTKKLYNKSIDLPTCTEKNKLKFFTEF